MKTSILRILLLCIVIAQPAFAVDLMQSLPSNGGANVYQKFVKQAFFEYELMKKGIYAFANVPEKIANHALQDEIKRSQFYQTFQELLQHQNESIKDAALTLYNLMKHYNKIVSSLSTKKRQSIRQEAKDRVHAMSRQELLDLIGITQESELSDQDLKNAAITHTANNDIAEYIQSKKPVDFNQHVEKALAHLYTTFFPPSIWRRFAQHIRNISLLGMVATSVYIDNFYQDMYEANLAAGYGPVLPMSDIMQVLQSHEAQTIINRLQQRIEQGSQFFKDKWGKIRGWFAGAHQ